MSDVLRWLIGGLLLVFFAGAATTNIILAIRARLHGEHHSLVPFVGGLAGCLGLLILPLEALHAWWWVPLIIDIGAGYLMLAVVVVGVRWLLRRLRSTAGRDVW